MLTLTSAQMKQAEQLADERGLSYRKMMENAGAAAFRYLSGRYDLPRRRCAVLAGSGNNGGDAFVVARLLLEAGCAPWVLLCSGQPRTELAEENCRRMLELGGRLLRPEEDGREFFACLREAEVIIDGVFGTGFHGELPPLAASLIGCANTSAAARIALDVPSGMDADTGRSGAVCFRADVTLSFAACKPAHRNPAARPACGLVEVLDIGIPGEIIRSVCRSVTPITPELIRTLLPERAPDSHKGDHGRLLLLAGSRCMAGAAMMCTLAALRSGPGLVTLAAPAGTARLAAPHLMEAMTLPLPEAGSGSLAAAAAVPLQKALEGADAWGAGCGLTAEPGVREVLSALIPAAECPILLDADALNCLRGRLSLLAQTQRVPVLTPHPGEMARLAEMTVSQVTENALAVARLFAKEHRSVVVLKGHRTLVASPEGEVFQNTTGNAGLAKGGSGDVLAGMISAFLAQGLSPRDAALCGVYIHGFAADSLSGRMGLCSMLARDVIAELPAVFHTLSR